MHVAFSVSSVWWGSVAAAFKTVDADRAGVLSKICSAMLGDYGISISDISEGKRVRTI